VLRDALVSSLAQYPQLRFATPLELATAIKESNRDYVEQQFRRRLRAWSSRVAEVTRFARLARMTGLAVPLWLLGQVL
jgi:hypothetical protein